MLAFMGNIIFMNFGYLPRCFPFALQCFLGSDCLSINIYYGRGLLAASQILDELFGEEVLDFWRNKNKKH